VQRKEDTKGLPQHDVRSVSIEESAEVLETQSKRHKDGFVRGADV
jgi:hypothetical protein